MRPSINTWKVPFACAVAVTSLPLALVLLSRHAAATSAAPDGLSSQPAVVSAPASVSSDPKAAPVEISLADALGRRWLQAEYRSNGHNELRGGVRQPPQRPSAGHRGLGPDLRDRRPAQPGGHRPRPAPWNCPLAGVARRGCRARRLARPTRSATRRTTSARTRCKTCARSSPRWTAARSIPGKPSSAPC